MERPLGVLRWQIRHREVSVENPQGNANDLRRYGFWPRQRSSAPMTRLRAQKQDSERGVGTSGTCSWTFQGERHLPPSWHRHLKESADTWTHLPPVQILPQFSPPMTSEQSTPDSNGMTELSELKISICHLSHYVAPLSDSVCFHYTWVTGVEILIKVNKQTWDSGVGFWLIWPRQQCFLFWY